ncbi:MAG: penicillin-binding protein 1C [Kiloniellales bacterium]|nr:penicillin-binding protein 1C [Kiloniellales bacterium]
MSRRPGHRWLFLAAALALLLPAAGLGGLWALDRTHPPDLARYRLAAQVVADREGRPLRIFLSPDQALRLPAAIGDVDPRYLRMLVAYEDKRFHDHPGVDPLALLRAVWQLVRHGRVISGASTLTMQAARLLAPRPRTFSAKLIEMARALQLEWRYDKAEILGLYLTLAPFGGNVEGVRAAGLAYLGRAPLHLTLAEAALLVALPQAPSRLRPDRFPEAARQARNRVLDRTAAALALTPAELAAAKAAPLSAARRPLPFAAPHLAERLRRVQPGAAVIGTTIDGGLQRRLEALVKRRARGLGPAASAAVLVVDGRDRAVLAYLGSADFHDAARAGQVDMVSALRSPGSTLKPFIYGLAFERGLAHPRTLVEDAPRVFGGYAPRNFGKTHHGLVSLSRALQLSLNVPAVAVLDSLGPVAFAEALRRCGVTLRFPGGDRPGLPLALGGVGTRLEDLARLYAALGTDGRVRPLRLTRNAKPDGRVAPLLGPGAREEVAAILAEAPRPPGFRRTPGDRREIAFKTGTSYGFRDAWALGFDARYTVAVWLGRPDGTPSPGRFGLNTAAPLLFEVFGQLPQPDPSARPGRAGAARETATGDLPPGLRRLRPRGALQADARAPSAPRIVFPLDDSLLVLPPEGAVQLQAAGGARPYAWLIDGRPLGPMSRRSTAGWRPGGPGFAEITLIDSHGRRDQTLVRVRAAAE